HTHTHTESYELLFVLLFQGNDDKLDIEVKEHGDVLMLKCDGGSWTGTTELSKIIHVKFRTGENMIELDTPAVVGICVGNIIATILIGVSVYCIAAQPSQRTFSGSKGRSLPNNKTQFTQSIFIMCLFRWNDGTRTTISLASWVLVECCVC
uniref:Uncharacterized protein n=1 Tax=Denticeps clupeoides TaxID=299321 RepID=A0AAY4ED26_9TELE